MSFSVWLVAVLGAPGLALAQTSQELATACQSAGTAYVPASSLTEFQRHTPADPRDDACGMLGNEIACPGLVDFSSLPGVSRFTCCKRPIGTSQTEYACVQISTLAAPGGEQDATYVAQDLSSVTPPPPDEPVTFVPQVTVPGSITIGGKTFTVRAGEGIAITTSTAIQYFALFYRFFVAMLAVAAVVMVMWGGFKRIIAAGNPTKISDANDSIFSALSGLVIALISYSLLSLVNPQLVNLQPLDAITPISRIEFTVDQVEAQEDIPSQGSVGEIFPAAATGTNIVNPSGYQADIHVVLDLRNVALKLQEQGITLVIASGLRTPQRQRELMVQNCQEPESTNANRCIPKPGKPTTCYLRDGDTSCPHTSGKAVDVWAAVGNINPISQKDCMKNKSACRQDKAMAAMGKAMQEEGFCNLASEPWHFEKPKMSSTCQSMY